MPSKTRLLARGLWVGLSFLAATLGPFDSGGARADTVQWDFEGDLASANGGHALMAHAAAPAKAVGLTWLTMDMDGAPAKVARFDRGTYFRLRHGFAPNAEGFVDTYTVVMDVRLDRPSPNRRSWRSLLQMQHTNNGDADWGVNRRRRLGVSRNFGGKVMERQWHRLALVVDGRAGTASSYINGRRVSRRKRIREGERWLMEPELLVFADNDKENTGGWISSLQVHDRALSDEEIGALGGTVAEGIARQVASAPSWVGPATEVSVAPGQVLALRWKPGAHPQGHVDVVVGSEGGKTVDGPIASVRQSAGAYDWRVSPFRAAGNYAVTLAWGPGRAQRSPPLRVQVTGTSTVAPSAMHRDLIKGGRFDDALGADWTVVTGRPSVQKGRLASIAAGDYRVRQVVDLTSENLAAATNLGLSVSASARLGSVQPAWRFDDQAWVEVSALDAKGHELRRFVSLHDAGPKGIVRVLGGALPSGTTHLQVDAVSRHLRGKTNGGWLDDITLSLHPRRAVFEPRTPRITKGPILQDVRGDVMTILWETNIDPTEPFVEIGEAGDLGDGPLARRAAGIETRRIDPWRYLHIARLEGLKPQTRYRYRVGVDGMTSADFSFRTAPVGATPFSIGWMSDNQYGWRTFRKLLPKLARRKPDLAVFPGDIVQNGYDLRQWHTQWFKSLAVEDFVAKTPLMFARGNHDGEWPYAYGYSALPGYESFYSFTYGNTFIIVLDTESGKYGSTLQTRWLKAQLTSKAYKDAAFRIATMHKPPYTNLWDGRHDYDGEAFVRDKWVPLFERYRLDLCVAGHAHAYERGRKRGVTYVVVGGAGGRLDDDRSGDWPFFRKLVPKYHYNMMHVDGGKLVWRAYDINDRSIDRFNLTSRHPDWRRRKARKLKK